MGSGPGKSGGVEDSMFQFECFSRRGWGQGRVSRGGHVNIASSGRFVRAG